LTEHVGAGHDTPVATCTTCGAENAAEARFCSQCGAAIGTRVAVEERRVVSVLFADLVGSTSLGERTDPEIMRGVIAAFFELCAGTIRRHGGTVEQFSGDAVLGIFGMRVAHEDDAERAVRAAVAIRDGMAVLADDARTRHGLTLDARFGIESGEVVVGDPFGGRTMATGDPMNVAARLEQHASAGEILIGPNTERAARQAVEVESAGALELKGKAQAIPTWRVLSASAEIGGVRGVPGLSAPLTGRDDELALLLDAARRSRAQPKAVLFTVLGVPGVGKSRLARELADRLASEGTRVLRGRCLPYGEGITYWPLDEMIRSWAGITPTMTAPQARARLEATTPDPAVAERLAFAAGIVSEVAWVEAIDREIAWAFRKLFGSLASDAPLLLVFEDIHWAEPALLDLVEYLATWLREHPVLLLCLARPELLDQRPAWGATGRIESSRIHLEPLGPAESRALLGALLDVDELPATLRQRVLDRAEGNPLYVEEVVRMLIDRGAVVRSGGRWVATSPAGDVAVPESIEALIRARLDTLPSVDRAMIQTASVVGRVFHRSAVAALADSTDLDHHLEEAILRDLIVPERSPDEDPTYRFKHILIRDVAYSALPKARRAGLHLGVADWLEGWVGERVDEFIEILGYHLEQAVTLRREVDGAVDEALLSRAATILTRCATLSLARHDLRAAERFARRALAVGPPEPVARLEAQWSLAEALLTSGRYAQSGALGTEIAREASALGRTDLEGRGLLAAGNAAWITPTGLGEAAGLEMLARARRLLEDAGDLTHLFEVIHSVGFGAWADGRLDDAIAGWEEALPIARSIPDAGREARIQLQIARAHALAGRLSAAIERLRAAERVSSEAGDRRTRLETARSRAVWITAPESAEAAVAALSARLPEVEETGDNELLETFHSQIGAEQYRAGDLEGSRSSVERALEISEASGHTGRIPEDAADLAVLLVELGDVAEAERHARHAIESAADWDVSARAHSLVAMGEVRRAQGRFDEAEALMREGVSIFAVTEYVGTHHQLMTPLACLLLETGRTEEGESWAERAVASARTWGEDAPVARIVERRIAEARAAG
jgi:predicted ATPase/class 3 adenylate cyclase